ncbi:DNA polymerase III subunit alpha [Bacillus toyonensis]|uniref:DNA polymerase III subunit alpha n=1 Tax=Bacillus toyonensis TaxID=155322 RepID=UPI000BFB50CA|nr:DNA polymerase III subunit alpha [Bacillus toyonensis]PHD51841.1 DNA polymerase III subunit alpha [Bacillus toyonensis]
MTDELTVKLDFNQLHTHSCASKRDALSRVDDLVAEAKRLGQRGIAISDHGVLHAIPELYRECRKQGIKAVAAMEGYLTEDVNDPDSKTNYHQVLIAINETGWKNLMRLSSEAFTHFHNRPRFDWAIMEKYSEGIIATSSCLSGVIPTVFKTGGDKRKAYDYLNRYQDIFGDRFYLEIQPTPIPEQKIVNEALIRMNYISGVPLVATGDVHYAKQEDYLAHQGVLALGWAKKLKHPDEPSYPCEEHYWMKPGELILEEFVAQGFDCETIVTAINNTGVILDKVDFDLKKEKDLLPEIEVPEGYTSDKLLAEMVKEGMMRKYRPVTQEVVDRIKFELGVIREKGYQDYFLLVADAIKWCKSQGIIVGPGRGSAGGSILAYCLDITEIDPLKYGLYFERFLDVTRLKLADIDSDIEDVRRYELINYLREKYGHSKVAQIVNYGRMTARLAFKNSCMIYDIPFKKAQEIVNLVDDSPNMTIEKARSLNPELVHFMDKSNEKFEQKDNMGTFVTAREISWMAQKFEGVIDKFGKHAGGILIMPDDVSEHIPTYLPDHNDPHTVVTQFDKDDVEELGGVKLDFLGLKTLRMAGYAVNSIEKEHGIKLDVNEIMRNPDDPKVFELIATGNTQNLFQFNSSGMQGICKRSKPKNFTDCVAITSLYRPAALSSGEAWKWCDIKNGLEEAYYGVPEEKYLLGETYGIITYQEDVMRLVNFFAGWSMGKGDSLRKKSTEQLEDMRGEFLEDATSKGYDRDKMDELWTRIINYNGYGFNKAHGVAYTKLTYLTAYLELYYKEHWIAAIMSTKMSDQETISQGFQDIRQAGFDFVAPDINESGLIFVANKGKIVFPLSVIKGVGDKAVSELIANRPYTSLEDLMEKVNLRVVSSRAMKPLIYSGALDSLYHERNRQEIYLHYMKLKGASKKEREALAELPEWTDTEKAEKEKELLGIYISTHPLSKYHFRDWNEYSEGDNKALLGGIILKSKTFLDKNKNRMAFLTVETYQSTREVVCFASTYSKFDSLIKEGNMVMISGKKQGEKMLANTFKELN